MTLAELVEAVADMVVTVRAAGLKPEDVDVKVLGERGVPHLMHCKGTIGGDTVLIVKDLS